MTKAPPNRDTLISGNENREMFDAIAHRYDLMNQIISLGQDRRWRRRAIEKLNCRAGGCYLDVGSGTGDLAVDIVLQSEETTVIGLDPSKGMLSLGQEKAGRQGRASSIRHIVGDAMALPLADRCVDGIVLGFSIRNVEDRLAAVREFHRVLKSGGRLVILELTVPSNPFFSLGHRIYTSTIIPAVSFALTQKGAYDYLVKSVRAFPPAGVFLEQMLACGFAAGEALPLLLGSVTLFCLEK